MSDTLTTKQISQLLYDKTGVQIFIRDPADNSPILGYNSREMIFNWCFENCQGKFWIGMGFGRFELDDDATLFKLRWL